MQALLNMLSLSSLRGRVTHPILLSLASARSGSITLGWLRSIAIRLEILRPRNGIPNTGTCVQQFRERLQIGLCRKDLRLAAP